MIRLVRAERLKLTSTRMWWILVLAGIGLVTLTIAAQILAPPTEGLPSLETEQGMRSLWSALGGASLIALILGIVSITGEFRHQTITDSFLTEPNRARFLAAKSVVQAGLGAVLAVACAGTGVGLAFVLLTFREHVPVDPGHILWTVLGVVVSYVLYAVLGVAVGALLTNQILAIVVSLLWVSLIESLLIAFLPAVGKWLPGGASSAILSTETPFGGDLLPAWAGALLLVGYAAAFSALALRTTLRRDIT